MVREDESRAEDRQIHDAEKDEGVLAPDAQANDNIDEILRPSSLLNQPSQSTLSSPTAQQHEYPPMPFEQPSQPQTDSIEMVSDHGRPLTGCTPRLCRETAILEAFHTNEVNGTRRSSEVGSAHWTQ